MDTTADRAIAIVGVGCILPDALNVDAFWHNLLSKRYSITQVPEDRWRVEDYYHPDIEVPDKTYSRIGGWVRGFQFDWKRFKIPPRVAAAMDQGQQWALQIASDALTDYGCPDRALDTDRTAVILGTAMGGELHYQTFLRLSFPEYARALRSVEGFEKLPAPVKDGILARWQEVVAQSLPPVTEDSMPGELPNIISGRVANVLNLHGPNFITDAACAASFAAINSAVEMLVEHHIDAVVTGGIDRNMGVSTFIKFCKIGALSATGSRPFGDGADGFVMGEGSASFVLKRLEDAERAGDKIYAVIRGIGGSSDGRGKGITAPNPIGQKLAMGRAWENAGLDPATAGMVEAHGTSTRVGDIVEVESLNEIYRGAGVRRIGLGSVKSNIGHLKAGAGAAGLLKATLALHHKTLPPTLNAERPNPNIDFDSAPFTLIHEVTPWEKANGTPRRAGVSAYGFGGTNFHLVLEEHVPGLLTQGKRYAGVSLGAAPAPSSLDAPAPPATAPVRGMIALGANTPNALKDALDGLVGRIENGWMPPPALPRPADLAAKERLLIDFGDHDELLHRAHLAQKAMGFDSLTAWKPLQSQGIFRGSGERPGKIAFLFPGQGSQYVNMGRELIALSPVVREVFEEADRVMTPILGKPLTRYIFVDAENASALTEAEINLMQTAITQPAMLTLDIALYRLLESYGFKPDMVMGHSLGEYAALVVARVMPFAEALEAAAARGSEMSRVEVEDKGRMAAVIAPYDAVVETLSGIDGYVVPANINSASQSVIGGESAAVDAAVERFIEAGYKALPLPVSHAFHTRIVAPASAPLRQMLDRLHIAPPRLPLVGNVTGRFYPSSVEAIKDLLQEQIASPVQWVKGLETLYDAGARTFVEVGPKRALKGFVDDVFAGKSDLLSLLTNHPKQGALASLNQALCGLYAAGYAAIETAAVSAIPAASQTNEVSMPSPVSSPADASALTAFSQLVERLMQQNSQPAAQSAPFDRSAPPRGSVVLSGSGLGLPGAEKRLFDPDNARRILQGEQFIDLIPERFRRKMLSKRVTRLVKSEDGNNRFETITDPGEVIKLAARAGAFDLAEEFGVPDKLIEALDITTQLAMAAGLDALREAGIPLVQTFRPTSTGKFLPDRWMLPESLRDSTGVIFASAFPGGDRYADEFNRYFVYQNRLEQLALLEDLRRVVADPAALSEISRRMADLRDLLDREPYEFDRRFIFRVLAMGHSQFAEYIGARGPNTHVNAACASTTQALAIAEDWIRAGRCQRVIVIGADNVTSDRLLEWIGAGFLATGAAATDDRVEEAALPFDRRRHGTILGMGACALVVESEDAVRERGMRGIVEVLSTETRNSAFHGTRLDVSHISQVMEALITSAERRFGVHRQTMAAQTVFMSHETFTPARGGSASAEIAALRHVFGEVAKEIIIANTKGFTGHPMGVGIEDVIALKILEYGIVPPVPNFKEVDEELGVLNLSRGGRYPVQYALHLSAGFGSQIALCLTRRIPGGLDRVDSKPQYQRWLDEISGCDAAETEVEKRVLRIKSRGAPGRTPVPNRWQYGTEPQVRTLAGGSAPAVDLPPRVAAPVYAAPPAAPPSEPVRIVRVIPEPAAPVAPPKPVEAEQTPAADLTGKVLEIVAAQTGYPIDMLDLDLDLEADLGIDTIKQAETFAAIRAAFDIPRRDDLKLRDYPTLARVVQFVRDSRPDLAAPVATAAPVTATIPAPSAPAGNGGDNSVTRQVLEIVAAQTGYPIDMLDLDLDLEADLGIDTIKQAETFAAIRAAFDIPRRDDLKLRDYPTLARVVQFVRDSRPDLAAPAVPAPMATAAPVTATIPAPPTGNGGGDPVTRQVLEIVAAQTGYPIDMLDLDLDLEADLGIDTIKQAETFAAIRAAFDIPRRDDLKLRDYPTLGRVVQFVRDSKPELAGAAPAAPAPAAAAGAPQIAQPAPASMQAANSFPRRVVVPILRLALDDCKPTGVELSAGSRVLVMPDAGGTGAGGTGAALIAALGEREVTVLALDPEMDAAAIDAQIAAWLSEGGVQGVYWLPALDIEPDLETLDLAEWRALNAQRVKKLYTTLRALYETISVPGTFLVSATRLGGLHGCDPTGAAAPLGGAVTGFSKAYKRERDAVLVKAVDFSNDADAESCAGALIAETLRDPGVVEVGYDGETRTTLSWCDEPVEAPGPGGMTLNAETVFVVTGAAGGITSAIVGDLAAASGGIFYLLDLTPEPKRDDDKIALLRRDREALKTALVAEAQAAGEKLKPVQLEKRIAAVERQEAALRAIQTVEAAGGRAFYRSADLRDSAAAAAIVEEVRAAYGRIDVLVHAAGLEISRTLPDKDPDQFNLVFDVKADGFFNLLRAAKGLPLGATVAFSSVAGRFGNSGQTDYSAANDLLCKISSSLRRWRPETRGIVIDWTAWGGIGMATRGSIPKIMEMAGIEMLPPEAGIPVVRRELTASAFSGEVVIGGRLGILGKDWDETGGLDADALTARARERRLLMIGEVKRASLSSGLEVETTLDPKAQPFLYDHAMDGTPLLPGVMGVESFAEIASLIGLAPTAVRCVHFENPFKFFRMEPAALHLSALPAVMGGGGAVVHATLRSARTLASGEVQKKVHFTAEVLSGHGREAPVIAFTPPQPEALPISAEQVYRVYFHGPAYQVVERAGVEGDRAVGLMRAGLPPNSAPADAASLMAPRLIELCFQTAGLWEMKRTGALALPLGIDRAEVYRQPDSAGEKRLYALVEAVDGGASFNAQVVDETGAVYLTLEGYRTVRLPGTVEL